jgi:hypothetical protein
MRRTSVFSQERRTGSKGKWLTSRKLAGMAIPSAMAYFPIFPGFLSPGKRESRAPLAARPSMAMLTIMAAKWYETEIEYMRVRRTSKASEADEETKMTGSMRCSLSMMYHG